MTAVASMRGPRRATWQRLAVAAGLDETATESQIVAAIESAARVTRVPQPNAPVPTLPAWFH